MESPIAGWRAAGERCDAGAPARWAKLGQLVLNRGVWNDRQIVPSAWI